MHTGAHLAMDRAKILARGTTMSLTISFSPEVEARLRERAAASGKDVPTLVREAVEEKLSATTPEIKPRNGMSREQWLAEFNAWVNSHNPVGHFVDDSRESIYAGRGE
jgi:predicted transcriptional regulator